MKNVVRPKEIKDLLAVEGDACISIYMPTHEKGVETREDPIRFKNLLRTCEKRLKERDLTGGQSTGILRPAYGLLDASIAWRHLDHGLAAFISAEIFRAFALPIDCPEQLWVGTHFYIKPLVPLWASGKRFCVLALSRGRARFYEADRWSIRESPLDDAPQSLDAFLKDFQAEKHLQYHTAPSGKSAGAAAMFHGHGNIGDDARRKKMVDEYVKAVRNAVEGHLAGDNRPLVLVALEYIQSSYRAVSHYSHLVATGVVQSPDRLSENQLHDAALDVMRPRFEHEVQGRLRHYQELLSRGRASDDLKEIVPAAKQGRVQTLLLDPTVSVWQHDAAGASEASPASQENGEDLLEVAVRGTLSRGGDVYAVAKADLPTHSPAGAILRY